MFSAARTLRSGHVALLLAGLAAFGTLFLVLHAPQPPGRMSGGVGVWWVSLCALGVFNAYAWCLSASVVARRQGTFDPAWGRFQRLQLLLSAAYVLGCGFRSVLPRADVQRLGLYDSWVSSVMVGRSVATVAELCFAIQGALLLYVLSREADSRTGVALSWVIVPLIAVAEVCSWYAVLTTCYLGNALEESLWAVSAGLLALGCLSVWPRSSPQRRPVLGVVIVLSLGYLAYMCLVDVPMYVSRWRADEAEGRAYLTLAEGCHDVWHRRDVTFAWDAWRDEVPWMTLYFSLGVWCSIALAHLPRLRPTPAGAPGRALPPTPSSPGRRSGS